jgi:cytochrome c-type biogenesis protein
MSWTSIPVAFLAGMVSFLAPCVLPLVPAYLSAVSAVDAERLGQPGTARRVVTGSVPFVVGFTAFFVLLGVGAALVGGRILGDQFLLERIAGFVLVLFGLAFMGLLPWPERLVGASLLREARGRGSRVLLGGAFAVCAAPCIGPVLAAILVLAGSSETVLQGAALLGVYSLGLAVPFVLAAALFTRAMSAFRWLRDHYRVIQVGGGAVMVALGLLLFFERFYVLRVYLNRFLEWLGLEPAF